MLGSSHANIGKDGDDKDNAECSQQRNGELRLQIVWLVVVKAAILISLTGKHNAL